MDKTAKVILAVIAGTVSLAALAMLGKAISYAVQEANDQEDEEQFFQPDE